MPHHRRSILKSLAALTAAASFPDPISRALALPARGRTGTIADVRHVVILMQENRSFDHYFGTLRGVRGFGDPRPAMLRSNRSVFHQPTPDGAAAILPFRLDSQTTSAPLIDSLDHSWKGNAAEWADYDCWIRHKTPLTMGHFARPDIPFYHALADAFTIGDAYHCSIHGPTSPNRMYLFSGTSGLAVGDLRAQVADNIDDGNWTGDSRRDKLDFAAFGWTTYPERLERAGVSWKVYQEYDNFGDNTLAYFKAFRGLADDHPLHRRGRAIVAGSTSDNSATGHAQPLVDAFAADVAADRLPQVSWIVAPEAYSEHPKAPPAYGESLTARLLDALTANPDVWGRTAFIINYDENDGFFDHMPPPLPATSRSMGLSTVSTAGEVYKGQAVGLGPRVPLIIVSPWTRGGWVNSQLFDHSSVIRFLELRFGVAEPNITPWRRAVAGDLTTMFDFADPDGSAISGLARTADYLADVAAAARRPAPRVPSDQAVPKQEPGQRPARALPYRLEVAGAPADGGFEIAFANTGTAGAVFTVYAEGSPAGPWFYTVEPGKPVVDTLPGLAIAGGYAIAVHGPNGFLRTFAGEGAIEAVAARAAARRDGMQLLLRNTGPGSAAITLSPGAYGGPGQRITLAPGGRHDLVWPTAGHDGWYDVTVALDDGRWTRRFAGHVEDGRASRSDPAIA